MKIFRPEVLRKAWEQRWSSLLAFSFYLIVGGVFFVSIVLCLAGLVHRYPFPLTWEGWLAWAVWTSISFILMLKENARSIPTTSPTDS